MLSTFTHWNRKRVYFHAVLPQLWLFSGGYVRLEWVWINYRISDRKLLNFLIMFLNGFLTETKWIRQIVLFGCAGKRLNVFSDRIREKQHKPTRFGVVADVLIFPVAYLNTVPNYFSSTFSGGQDGAEVVIYYASTLHGSGENQSPAARTGWDTCLGPCWILLIGILAPFGTLKLQLEIYVMFIQGIVKAYISDETQKTIRVKER